VTMGWQELLSPDGNERVLPWTGGRQIHYRERTWTIKGKLPTEHGWYSFLISGGRKAELKDPADPDPEFRNRAPVGQGIHGGRSVNTRRRQG